MNELDLQLAELVEVCRVRRQLLRTVARRGKRGKINLAKAPPRSAPTQARVTA